MKRSASKELPILKRPATSTEERRPSPNPSPSPSPPRHQQRPLWTFARYNLADRDGKLRQLKEATRTGSLATEFRMQRGTFNAFSDLDLSGGHLVAHCVIRRYLGLLKASGQFDAFRNHMDRCGAADVSVKFVPSHSSSTSALASAALHWCAYGNVIRDMQYVWRRVSGGYPPPKSEDEHIPRRSGLFRGMTMRKVHDISKPMSLEDCSVVDSFAKDWLNAWKVASSLETKVATLQIGALSRSSKLLRAFATFLHTDASIVRLWATEPQVAIDRFLHLHKLSHERPANGDYSTRTASCHKTSEHYIGRQFSDVVQYVKGICHSGRQPTFKQFTSELRGVIDQFDGFLCMHFTGALCWMCETGIGSYSSQAEKRLQGLGLRFEKLLQDPNMDWDQVEAAFSQQHTLKYAQQWVPPENTEIPIYIKNPLMESRLRPGSTKDAFTMLGLVYRRIRREFAAHGLLQFRIEWGARAPVLVELPEHAFRYFSFCANCCQAQHVILEMLE